MLCSSISKQWVMCRLMSDVLSPAHELEQAPVHHGLLKCVGSLVHSSQTPDSQAMKLRIPKTGSMKLEFSLLPLNPASTNH